jgi:hypothetical protein
MSRRLVAALTGALGDIEGKQDESSATHTRCLICDKPVKSIALASLTSSKGARAFSPSHFSSSQHSTPSSFSERETASTGSMPVRQGLVPYPSSAVLLSQSLPQSPFRPHSSSLQAPPANQFSIHNYPHTSSAPNGSSAHAAMGQHSKNRNSARTSGDPDGETQGAGDVSHLPVSAPCPSFSLRHLCTKSVL